MVDNQAVGEHNMKIKSFRGQIAMGGQETIRLSTNQGTVGYKIKKFRLMSSAPGTASVEYVAKAYTFKQSSINATVDFNDPRLLAVSYYQDEAAPHYPSSEDIIFDAVKFNQDIFVTVEDAGGGSLAANYYLELEQVKLSVDEAAVATLKDMRGSN